MLIEDLELSRVLSGRISDAERREVLRILNAPTRFAEGDAPAEWCAIYNRIDSATPQQKAAIVRALTGGGAVQRFAEARSDDDEPEDREKWAKQIVRLMGDHFKRMGGAKAGEAFIRSVKQQSPSEFAETKRAWQKHVQKHGEDRGLLPLPEDRQNLKRAELEPPQEGWTLNSKKPAPVNAGVTGGDPDPLRGDRDHTVGKGLAAGGLMRAEAVGRFSERFNDATRRRAMKAVGLTEERLRTIIDKATPEQLEQLV
jgi:hypothetical protein